ncbi:MAG: sulfotransferase domain-containing protein [Vicinamibacterales bacterium]
MIWIWLITVAVALFIASALYLAWYLRWENAHTRGMAYYGQPLTARRTLKRQMRRYARPALPLVYLVALMNRKRSMMPVFEYEGVCGPTKVSSPEVFARAKQYRPQPEDVFVVTQMRCGTTWMQQIVYQIVTRGRGDFGEDGQGHMYAMSPWIDAVDSVSIEDAPLVGDMPTRIIKCHLPTELCPYSEQAKYIYVARHPVSCFASIVDFNRSMLGPLLPPVATLASWFCSDRMYWLPWPRHVDGWWEWAERRDNVLFVHFEEMKSNFVAVCDRVAAFLGCSLSADEKRRVEERSSFQYMKNREEMFEMAPPTMFSVARGVFMASGKASRHEDVTAAIRLRIVDYCQQALSGREYPARRFYPDLVTPPTSSSPLT